MAKTETAGNALVRNVRAWLRRYVGLSEAQTLVLALWALHTWVYDRLTRTTPYLEITGVSGSGKTTAMEALALISRNSEILNTLRTLYMCRRVEEQDGAVTLFIDEAERLNGNALGDQRSMLASGYRAGAVHGVSVGKQTVRFRSYCPKVFTSCRTLTTVLHNRCIPIWMERQHVEASLSREYERAEATAAELVQEYVAVLKSIDRPVTAEADWLTSERDVEIWTPLVSMARTLQVDDATFAELVAASVDLSALRGIERHMDVKDEDEAAAERSYAVRLVQDARQVLQPGETLIASTVLVERLRALPAGPWRAYDRNGLTEISLAQLLGAFGLEPKQRRIKGKGREVNPVRGWLVSDLQAVKL